jgi:hypothetical protein
MRKGEKGKLNPLWPSRVDAIRMTIHTHRVDVCAPTICIAKEGVATERRQRHCRRRSDVPKDQP